MKLTLKMDLDNAAFRNEDDTSRFREGAEVARILRGLAAQVVDCPVESGDSWPLCDINGNKVGEAKITR